jgi:putative ABC transport system ATP-binding protein
MSEDTSTRTGTTEALVRSFDVAPGLKKGIGITLTLAVIGTALQLVVPIMLQQIIDNQLLGSSTIDEKSVLVGGLIALVAIGFAGLARWQSLKRLAISSATGLAQLRVRTFEHLHRLSVIELQSERRGALVARVTSDVETIQHFMEWGGVGMILGVTQLVLAMTVMLIYRWQLALVVLVGVVIYAIMIIVFQRILSRAHDRVRERVGDALSTTGEAISGLSTVRAYGIEAAMTQKVDDSLDRQFSAEVRTAILASSLFSSAELFAGILTAVVVGVGVVLGGGWGMTAGTLIAFLFLVNLLIEPVQALVESIDQAQSAAAGLRKILGVLDTPISIPDPEDGVELGDTGVGVRFEDVTFAYPSGPEILSHVSVAIEPGERVAVVGETGSGKTTFAKLATRLMTPKTGSIFIGEIPVDTIALSSLRSTVSYVPQEGFLFEGTIADNIRYGRPGIGDEIVRSAFADLGLLDWLDALPDGVSTDVGERGSNLSAGERQLVALARAWIANPSILVLDEATSAVDPALEVRIRNAIEFLTSGRTSITIAHRLSTAEASDRVLVFDAGIIVEDGHHSDLLAAGGVYRSMHADWAGSTASDA